MITREEFESGSTFKAITKGIPNDWQFRFERGFVMMRRSEEGSGEWTDYCHVDDINKVSFNACHMFFGTRLVFRRFLFFEFGLVQEGGTDGI